MRFIGIFFISAVLLLPISFGFSAKAAGDIERGRKLARECFACHGMDGYSPSPINPKIGGQHERYIFLSLKQYRDGERSHSLMRGSVLGRDDGELQDIAAYYASQPGYLTRREIRQRKNNTSGSSNSEDTSSRSQDSIPKFDHSDQISSYNSLLARAVYGYGKGDFNSTEDICETLSVNGKVDSDGDGVLDVNDSLPSDPKDFVSDVNGDGYYEICNIGQFEQIGKFKSDVKAPVGGESTEHMSRKYQLVRDLDASSIENFSPIGDCGPEGNCMVSFDTYGFQGVIDGEGHRIKGLKIINTKGGGVGLVGVLGRAGIVRNLIIEDGSVTGRAGVGLLVGSNFGVVYNCSVQGIVIAELAVGGMVGGSAGVVAYSSAEANISGNQAIGGLVGDMRGAVYFSSANANVSGSRGLGGLVGLNTFGVIVSSYSTGNIYGENDLGGLVGMNTDAKIRNSFSSSNVQGSGSNIGGLIGFHSLGEVKNSFAEGSVSGLDAVGGLIGRNNGLVKRTLAMGAIESSNQSGGISGITMQGQEIESYWLLSSEPNEKLNFISASGIRNSWNPEFLPLSDLLDYFCDSNTNGFIDPKERNESNYIWIFGNEMESPSISCISIS